MSDECEVVNPPSMLLMALEGRAIIELWGCLLALPMLSQMPRGDGHPVLVLPGFGTADWYMFPLRMFLRRLGYKAHGWRNGYNLGYSKKLDNQLRKRLTELYDRYGQKVSLAGWSLGGVYAREMARWRPQMVRFVITLGSPFSGIPTGTNIWRLYEYVSGQKIDELDPQLLNRMRKPPPVPTTAIYSRTDGVTSHKCCIEREAPLSENIEVSGSHCGLAHNPIVLWALADRLAQPENKWRPFKRTGLRRFFYGEPGTAA
jgi:hypothetical protein